MTDSHALPVGAPLSSAPAPQPRTPSWDVDRRVVADLRPVYEQFDAVGQWQASSDGLHVAAAVTLEDGSQQVCVDGTPWEAVYEKAWHLRFGPDGRLAALVRLDDQWTVAVDGQEWPERFDYVWNTKFSRDGSVIAAQIKRDARHSVALDGVAWDKDFLSIRDFTLSDDGKHAAAAAQSVELAEADIFKFMQGTWSVVVDGELWGRNFVNAYDPRFSEDGKHVAAQVRTAPFEYTIAQDAQPWTAVFGCVWAPAFRGTTHKVVAPVRVGGAWTVAEDGATSWNHRFVQLWRVQVTADGKHLAAVVAPSFGQWTIAVDDAVWACSFDSAVLDPRFAEDGKHVAAAVRHAGKWTIAVDGAAWGAGFDRVGEPVFVPGSASVLARVEQNGAHRLARDGRTVGASYQWLWDPVVSPDGRRVLVRGMQDQRYVREVADLSQLEK